MKFPKLHRTRARLLSKFISRKIIPRVPYYAEPERKKTKLQITTTTCQDWTDYKDKKTQNQVIIHNMNEKPIEEMYPELREIRYFNQWTAAINFDILNYNRTYDNITIDENDSDYSTEEVKIEHCNVDFTKLRDMWKYINDIQLTGKWMCHKNSTNTIQNFFKQNNLDIYREIMKRPWLEAEKNVMKYFFITKKLIMKMQNNTNEKDLKQELELFKEEGIKIIKPERTTAKDLKRYREIRKVPNYNENSKEMNE
jgi:hypothetical protein